MPKSKTEERVEKVIGGFHNPNLKVHLRVSAIQRYYSGINYPTLKRGVIYSRDKKNQRLATLIFLIRIRILIVRNIKCSVIKDILLFSYLHPFWKKILEDVKGVPDLDLAAFEFHRHVVMNDKLKLPFRTLHLDRLPFDRGGNAARNGDRFLTNAGHGFYLP